MRFLLGALILVVLLLAVVRLLRGLTVLLGRLPSSPKPATKLMRDPVCGTYVAENTSLKTRSGQEELHFCSRQCQEEYLRTRSA